MHNKKEDMGKDKGKMGSKGHNKCKIGKINALIKGGKKNLDWENVSIFEAITVFFSVQTKNKVSIFEAITVFFSVQTKNKVSIFEAITVFFSVRTKNIDTARTISRTGLEEIPTQNGGCTGTVHRMEVYLSSTFRNHS
jgi:hypothetical protein